MADYRLSVAQVGAAKKMSDEIGAPYEQNLSLTAVHAIADAFLRLTGKARDQGIIGDDAIAELRSEIGTRLRPHKAQKYTSHELKVLHVLGRATGPLRSAEVAKATGLPRPAVNFALHALYARGAARREMDGRAGLYMLGESAKEFRAEPVRVGPGALLVPPVLSTGRRG